MTGRGGRPGPSEPVHNRCRCGHFPTTHLAVSPITTAGGLGFKLEPTAACSVCRAPACPKFIPAV